MRSASYSPYELIFKRPGGTSRGVLHTKETWFLALREGERFGIGECGLLRGLSVDDHPGFGQQLSWTADHIHLSLDELLIANREFPSIQFGLETAFRSLYQEDPMILYPSPWTRGDEGIPINGLVWMGEPNFMQRQIEDLLSRGFSCIKLKIGAIDFETECHLLEEIRKRFSPDEVTLRVDANGAFSASEAMDKLKVLSTFDLHSIEQPIGVDQWQELARLCAASPVPIALDEELIGRFDPGAREELVEAIGPQYLVLKPSLLGGMHVCDHWIELAESRQIGWWITSALESNVGLNAIAQYTYGKNISMPQGLGTGSLFTNNLPSPLEVEGEMLYYQKGRLWELDGLNFSMNDIKKRA